MAVAEGIIHWSDPSLRVASDSVRTARYRALQGWYRETILRQPPGRDSNGSVVSSLIPLEAVQEHPRLNFVTDQAGLYAEVRVHEVFAAGGSVDPDRLRRNMLSSMPLCFNIFGSLRDRPAALARLLSACFHLDIGTIEQVECEWAPPKREHLGDRTAFDAFITYTDGTGKRGFLGIETKYTEPFSPKQYDSEKYTRITRDSGYFRKGAARRLVNSPTNQLWRMSMLAASLVATKDFDVGAVAVLAMADDTKARKAVELVQEDVIVPEFVRFVALEDLVAAAWDTREFASWAATFHQRYLDKAPIS